MQQADAEGGDRLRLGSPLNQVPSNIGEEVADRTAALFRHALGDDQAVALLWVAFETKQADRLRSRKAQGFGQVEQRLRLFQMMAENALERVMVARAR